jgi:hypothetical protein
MIQSFVAWKLSLLAAAGSVSPSIAQLGDRVLELLHKDGCEPTMSALLEYVQAGLCRGYSYRASSSLLPPDQGRAHATEPLTPHLAPPVV